MKVNERMDPYFQTLADGIDSPVVLLNKHNELIYLNELSKEMGLNSFKVLKKIQNGEEWFGKTYLVETIPVMRFDEQIASMCILTRDDFEKEEYYALKTVFDAAYDGIIVVDTKGIITMISSAYKKFLQIENQDIIGRHVTEVIENTRLHIVAKTGIAEIAELQKIKENYIIASRIPIIKKGKVISAVGKIVFRNIRELDNLYSKINKIEQQLENYKDELTQLNKPKYTFSQIIGKSIGMQNVKQLAKKAATTDSNILIIGDSGTGKELFAHAIHQHSKRHSKAFIRVNCAAIPDDLLESELFGYEEGAFTGAKKGGKIGKFEVADQGTIFLDEIGDLPLHMQAKLLRVIQEKEIERIGSNTTQNIDVRIIAATNRKIEQMITEKKFRLDLYYRLNVVTLKIPDLASRPEDIIDYCSHFIDQFRTRYLKRVEGISDEALTCLKAYQWPGNVRELENIIERAINIIENELIIKVKHLPSEISGGYEVKEIKPLKSIVEEAEMSAILNTLNAYHYNKTKTASALGLSRTALYERMEKYFGKSVSKPEQNTTKKSKM